MQAGLPRRVVWPRMQSELLSKVQVLSMEKRQREQNPKVIYLFIYLSILSAWGSQQYATYTTWQKITYPVIIFEVLYELTYSHRHIFNSAAKALLKEVKIHGLPRRGGNLISWADCISPSINAKRRGLFVYSVELGVGVFPAQPLTFCTYVCDFCNKQQRPMWQNTAKLETVEGITSASIAKHEGLDMPPQPQSCVGFLPFCAASSRLVQTRTKMIQEKHIKRILVYFLLKSTV